MLFCFSYKNIHISAQFGPVLIKLNCLQQTSEGSRFSEGPFIFFFRLVRIVVTKSIVSFRMEQKPTPHPLTHWTDYREISYSDILTKDFSAPSDFA